MYNLDLIIESDIEKLGLVTVQVLGMCQTSVKVFWDCFSRPIIFAKIFFDFKFDIGLFYGRMIQYIHHTWVQLHGDMLKRDHLTSEVKVLISGGSLFQLDDSHMVDGKTECLHTY